MIRAAVAVAIVAVLAVAAWPRTGRRLSLAQGAAYHCRNRLDGGMLYLPRLFVYHCDAPSRLKAIRNLQGDGAPPAAGASSTRRWSRPGRSGLWLAFASGVYCAGWLAGKGRPGAGNVSACMACLRVGAWIFGRRPEPAFAKILQDNQRGTDDPDDRYRDSRRGQAVLNKYRRAAPQRANIALAHGTRLFICFVYLPERRWTRKLPTSVSGRVRPSATPRDLRLGRSNLAHSSLPPARPID